MTQQTFTRSTIRSAIVGILLNNTIAGANVFSSRVFPMQKGQMPALLIYTLNEQKRSLGESGTEPQFRVTLQIMIEGRAEGVGSGTETQLDNLADQVVNALLFDTDFVRMFDHFGDINIDFTYHDAESLPYGSASIMMEVVYDEVYQPTFPDLREIRTAVKLPTSDIFVVDTILPTEIDASASLSAGLGITDSQS